MHTPTPARFMLAVAVTVGFGACERGAPAPDAPAPATAAKPHPDDPHRAPTSPPPADATAPVAAAALQATQYTWTPTDLAAIRAWLDGTCAPETLKRAGKDTSCEAPGGFTLRMRSRTGHFLEPDAQEVALMVWDSRIPAALGGGYLIVLREGRDGWRPAAQLSDSGPGGDDARLLGTVPRADGREGLVVCRQACAAGCCEDRCALLYLDAPAGSPRAAWHPLHTAAHRADDARPARVQRAAVEPPAGAAQAPRLALTVAPPRRAQAAPDAPAPRTLRWTLDWGGGPPAAAEDNPKAPPPPCRLP